MVVVAMVFLIEIKALINDKLETYLIERMESGLRYFLEMNTDDGLGVVSYYPITS